MGDIEGHVDVHELLGKREVNGHREHAVVINPMVIRYWYHGDIVDSDLAITVASLRQLAGTVNREKAHGTDEHAHHDEICNNPFRYSFHNYTSIFIHNDENKSPPDQHIFLYYGSYIKIFRP